jgi:signal transduction histidine kinase
MTLDKRPVRCASLLDSTLLLFDAVAAKKGVSIVRAPSDCGDALVDVDEPKLVVVLRNLLSNALKFTPEGGRVTISKRVVDDAAALAMIEGSLCNKSRRRPSQHLRLRRRVAAQIQAETSGSSPRATTPGRGRGCCADPVDRVMRSLCLYDDAGMYEALLEDSAAAAGGFLLVEMADTGVGMAPESCARLFREVVQFDVNKNQGGNGSGMGECICKFALCV